ncbi:MAG: hypothetical protein WCK82_13730 [Bacteroidota bacterium]
MANVQSPPGLLSISEFLNVVGRFQVVLDIAEYVDKNDPGYETGDYSTLYTMNDCNDAWVLEFHHARNRYPAQIPLVVVQLKIHKNNGHKSLETKKCVKTYPDAESLLSENHRFSTLHLCRNFLSGKQLKSYVLYKYAYHELPAEYWCYDENWYRLLVDGCAQGNVPSIGDFHGCVYFKEEDANRCALIIPPDPLVMRYTPSPHHSSLINLDIYSTPWLQTLAAIHDAYGKDELARVAKSSILAFISEYIKKHNLDIASTDISFLAKFIRLAEQKEGKKYHAKRKLQKVNAQ